MTLCFVNRRRRGGGVAPRVRARPEQARLLRAVPRRRAALPPHQASRCPHRRRRGRHGGVAG